MSTTGVAPTWSSPVSGRHAKLWVYILIWKASIYMCHEFSSEWSNGSPAGSHTITCSRLRSHLLWLCLAFATSLVSVSSPPFMKLRDGGYLLLLTSHPLFIPSHRSELLCRSRSFSVKNSLSYIFPTVHVCSQHTLSHLYDSIFISCQSLKDALGWIESSALAVVLFGTLRMLRRCLLTIAFHMKSAKEDLYKTHHLPLDVSGLLFSYISRHLSIICLVVTSLCPA